MTEEQKHEVAVWTPTPFEGSDLLPTPQAPCEVEAYDKVVGRDNVEPDDLILPTLQLLQGQSDAVLEGIEGASPGKFYLTGTGEVLSGPLRVLAVHHSKSRAMFPNKLKHPETADLSTCLSRNMKEGSKYGLCDSCQLKDWKEDGDKDTPPPCSVSHNFVVMTEVGPAVLRLSKSSFKAARSFVTTWTGSNKNLWHHPIVLFVEKDSDDDGNAFFHLKIRWRTKDKIPAEMRKDARATYDAMEIAHKRGKLGSDQDGVPDGEPDGGMPNGGKPNGGMPF